MAISYLPGEPNVLTCPVGSLFGVKCDLYHRGLRIKNINLLNLQIGRGQIGAMYADHTDSVIAVLIRQEQAEVWFPKTEMSFLLPALAVVFGGKYSRAGCLTQVRIVGSFDKHHALGGIVNIRLAICTLYKRYCLLRRLIVCGFIKAPFRVVCARLERSIRCTTYQQSHTAT